MQRTPTLCALAAFALTACGGGGDDAGSGGPQAQPPPAATVQTARLTRSSLAVTGSNDERAREFTDESLVIAFTGNVEQFYYRIVPTGHVLRGGRVLFDKAGQAGIISLQFNSPAVMGAGTFTATALIDVCPDEACTQQMRGAPLTVNLTYTITGERLPRTTIEWHVDSLSAYPLHTTDTESLTFKLQAFVRNFPARGLHAFHSAPERDVIAAIDFVNFGVHETLPSGWADYIISLKPGNALGSGIFSDAVDFRVCFDAACTDEVPTGHFRAEPRIQVAATPGVEFTRRVVVPENGASGLAWSAATQRLYVVSTFIGTNGPKILAIDPQSGDITASRTLGTELIRGIAMASDANRLWIASGNMLRRVSLPALTDEVAVSVDGGFDGNIGSLVAVPGQPHRVMATLKSNDVAYGVRLYDDGSVLAAYNRPPNTGNPEFYGRLAASATPGDYLVYRTADTYPPTRVIDEYRLSGSTLALNRSSADVHFYSWRLRVGAGKVYADEGTILDVTTLAAVAKLAPPDRFELKDYWVDADHNRLYLVALSPATVLMSYALDTLQPIALLEVLDPEDDTSYSGQWSFQPFGADGLALCDGDRLVILGGRFFTTYDGSPAT